MVRAVPDDERGTAPPPCHRRAEYERAEGPIREMDLNPRVCRRVWPGERIATTSIGREDVDLCEGAALDPLIEHRFRPRAVEALPAVELVDELGKDASAFCGIGDDDGCRRQVCGDTVLEVEGEPPVRGEVGEPIARRRRGDAAQIKIIVSSVKHDLDPGGLARSPTDGGDVDGAILRCRRIVDGEGSGNVRAHECLLGNVSIPLQCGAVRCFECSSAGGDDRCEDLHGEFRHRRNQRRSERIQARKLLASSVGKVDERTN